MDALFSIIPTKFLWAYAVAQRTGATNQFVDFDAKNNATLERAFRDLGSAGSVEIKSTPNMVINGAGGTIFSCRFDTMKYTPSGNAVSFWAHGKSFEIRRSEVISKALKERRDVERRAHAFLGERGRREALHALFERYTTDDEIGFDVERFAEEGLGTDAASDVALLVLAYYGHCDEMGEFSEEQFVMTMARLQCETEADLRAQLPELRAKLDFQARSGTTAARPSAFMSNFWAYLYFYFKDSGKQLLPIGIAMAVMDIVLGKRWQLYPKWKSFCESIQESAKFGMSKMEAIGVDVWCEILRFVHKFPNDDGLEDAFAADGEFWTEMFDVFVEDFFPNSMKSKITPGT